MMTADVKLARIANIILRVADLKRSMAFYGGTLGMTLNFNFENFAFYDGGEVTLALNQTSAGAGEAGKQLTEIVFDVEDIHAAYEALAERGVKFSRPPRIVTQDATHDVFATDFRDPDGHALSIMGRVPRRD
jgi:catechol 2,3-dioxygenase-like lactoylglutathione lyase family enzyme